jgi:type II secretory pathway predicted ATPase ExeA
VYQEFFGFDRRPFPTHGATPPFISTPATDEALMPLERCAREGRGIGILSAPPGTGKTAVALEAGRRLSDTQHVVYLSSSNYTSRRGLLQAILFELGMDYAGLSEQEARLHIIEFARGLLPQRDGLVLLVDEADQLSEKLLEELRGLANYMHEGSPPLRLVLFGQLALDERLALPELDAFNQRVACHVVLEPLDRRQSAEYIQAALAACGAQLENVFTIEALDLICAASDGNVRCLHHLCDHALLLAFVAEEKPVSAATVRAALEDLQGMPLNWNVPAAPQPAVETDPDVESNDQMVDDPGDGEHDETIPEPVGSEPEATWPAEPAVREEQTIVIEFGGNVEPDPVASAPPSIGTDPDQEAVEVPPAKSDSGSREYRLEDRYAELDRLAEVGRPYTTAAESRGSDPHNPVQPEVDDPGPDRVADVPVPDTVARQSLEGELLAQISEMHVEMHQVTSLDDLPERLRESSGKAAALPVHDEAEWDVVQPEPEHEEMLAVAEFEAEPEAESQWELPQEGLTATAEAVRPEEEPQPQLAAVPVEESVEEPAEPQVAESRPQARESLDPEDGSRRYAFLFTRLRNRRRELAARSARST